MAITITIDGNPVCAHGPGGKLSLSVQSSINGRATAQLRIQDPTGEDYLAALPGEFLFKQIIVTDGSDTVFAGIVTVQKNSTEPGVQTIHYLDVDATDYTVLLDRRIVFGLWEEGEFCSSIISAMRGYVAPGGVDSAATDGVTSANVDPALTIGSRFIVDGLTIADALNALAQAVGATWWIDSSKDIHFTATLDAAPYDIDDTAGACDFASIESEQSTERYSNTRWVRRDFSSVPDRIVVFAGDGSTGIFFTESPLAVAPVLIRRTATYAETTIEFNAQVSDGDTITIDGEVYVFADIPSAAGHVQIGANVTETCRNLAYAINLYSTFDGAAYHSSTTIHATCEAAYEFGDLIWIRVREIGTGNGTAISTTAANITLGAATLTGAAAGDSAQPSVGEYGVSLAGTADWYWKQGSTAINQDLSGINPAAGEYLEVRYKALFDNWAAAYDLTDLAGFGRWESAGDDDPAASGTTSKSAAEAFLRKYGQIFTRFQYKQHAERQPLVNQVRPGMLQTISAPSVGIAAESAALITDVSRTWRYTILDGTGTWRSTNTIQGVVADEAPESWLEFFAPDSGGISGSLSGGGGGGSAATPHPWTARVQLSGTEAIGQDITKARFKVTGTVGLDRGYAIAGTAPSGAAFQADWKKSSDEGATWDNIFTGTDYIEIASGDKSGEQTSLATTTLSPGDWLRFDLVALAGAEKIEVVLAGTEA